MSNPLTPTSPDPIYTLCFLTRPGEILLLKRLNPPNRGLWNGVGGRIEPGEDPLTSCLREVREETGYLLTSAHWAGLLTWEGFETGTGGLHLFTAPCPPGNPIPCNEGELAWKPIPWAFHDSGVVSNLHIVLPQVLGGAPPQVYHFVYRAGTIDHYKISPINSPE